MGISPLQKGQEADWAFQTLKEAVTTAPTPTLRGCIPGSANAPRLSIFKLLN